MNIIKDNWGNQPIGDITNDELVGNKGAELVKKFKGAEQSIRSKTLHSNKEWKKEWHKNNTKRLLNLAYRKKLSTALKASDKVKERNRTQKNNPKWVHGHKKGVAKWIASKNYVNPRGMLGKKHKKETIKILKIKQSKVIHTLEWNNNISSARKGITHSKKMRNKISNTLKGKESVRFKSVQTPKGIFKKLKDAAIAYNVTGGAIKLWMKKEPKQFYFINDNTKSRKIRTPIGIFDNCKKAAEYFKITPQAMRARIISKPTEFYYIQQ